MFKTKLIYTIPFSCLPLAYITPHILILDYKLLLCLFILESGIITWKIVLKIWFIINYVFVFVYEMGTYANISAPTIAKTSTKCGDI